MKNDTRNNWVTMMFVCKMRYNCLREQSIMNDCEEAFREFEKCGFEFGPIGFGGNHVHFRVNIPKKYSVKATIIILKSRKAYCAGPYKQEKNKISCIYPGIYNCRLTNWYITDK